MYSRVCVYAYRVVVYECVCVYAREFMYVSLIKRYRQTDILLSKVENFSLEYLNFLFLEEQIINFLRKLRKYVKKLANNLCY